MKKKTVKKSLTPTSKKRTGSPKKNLKKAGGTSSAARSGVRSDAKSNSAARAGSSKANSRKSAKPEHVRANSSQETLRKVRFSVEKLMTRFAHPFDSRPPNIVAAILDDHQCLRDHLSLLKDTDAEMSERRRAYAQFAILLKSHSKSEERAVYELAAKMAGHEVHIKTAEGFVEHQLADDLLKRIESATEALEWSAHVNVLAEIVEHHLDEEERDFLPMISKQTNAKLDGEILDHYLELRASTQVRVSPENAGVLANVNA